MNRPAKPVFQKILNALSTYRDTVSAICAKYRADLEKARAYASKFKDEKAILRDRQTELTALARNEIREAGAQLGADIARQIGSLNDVLQDDLCHAVPRATMDLLNLYSTYGIKPTRGQLTALLTVNNGHLIGLEAIRGMLQKNGSNFTVKFADATQLEGDLETLSRFATMAERAYAVPQEYLREAVQIFAGQSETVPEPAERGTGEMLKTITTTAPATVYAYRDGAAYDTMRAHDLGSLQAASVNFDTMCERVQEMAGYWSADLGELEISEQLFDGMPEEKSATEIAESEEPQTALARDLGRAQAAAASAEGLKRMAR